MLFSLFDLLFSLNVKWMFGWIIDVGRMFEKVLLE